jgi:hypothetical protein
MLPYNIATYIRLIEYASGAGYRFITFDEISKDGRGDFSRQHVDSGLCLLRHDVDADLAAATAMAREEAILGVSSTYFLMLRSPCYNLMSRHSQQFAEKILNFGHHIGLHYDQGFDELRGASGYDTVQAVQREADWLEYLFDCKVSAVSFHQPSATLLQHGVDCGSRINTYDREYLSAFRYISDSNRVFPLFIDAVDHLSMSKALGNCYPQNIQLLIHPMWWVYDDFTTQEVWNRALLRNFENMQQQLIATEGAYGSERGLTITNLF